MGVAKGPWWGPEVDGRNFGNGAKKDVRRKAGITRTSGTLDALKTSGRRPKRRKRERG